MPTKQPRLALVIDDMVKQQIQHLAKKHRRSTSAEIVFAIEKFCAEHEAELADFIPETEDN